MTDLSPSTLLALCVWTEARGEPDDGKAAVARVVLNRGALHYSSDGTVAGTVLHRDQFSAFWFKMIGGKYLRVANDDEEARDRADELLAQARGDSAWPQCLVVSGAVLLGKYTGGADYQRLTSDTVLYYNPDVVTTPPAWADPHKYVCAIGAHAFYSR